MQHVTVRATAVASAAMHSRRLALLLSLVTTLASCKGGGGGSPSPPPAPNATARPMSVGLVFDIGGRGDNSFNDSAARGIERAKTELGIVAEELEPGDGADRESALRQLAAKEHSLVFGVGFLFTDDMDAVSKDFPQKSFACVDYTLSPGKTPPPNVAALVFKEEEGSFLVGALAALVSKTDKVGFVGGMEIPLIKKFEAGFKAGVKSVKPDATVIVKYAGVTGEAFKNPSKGKELAIAIYSQGADVIFHASGATGQGVFSAAQEQKKLAIGVDSDQYALAPGHVLTSMVKRVDVAVFETIKASKNGAFPAGAKTFDLASGGVDYVYDERNKVLIPDDVHAKVEALRAKIVKGEIQVPFE